METYLRRTYTIKRDNLGSEFPFWDYRSRRGAFSSSNSSFSSSNSSCDGSSIVSSTSSRSESGSESVSISDHSDTDSLLPCEQQKMVLQFLTDSNDICAMEELFQPITNLIDPELHILKITDKSECLDNSLSSFQDLSARIPSVAILIFLQEEGTLGFERTQIVRRYFEKSPWKFHHSEQLHRGTINPYPYNSQDFYYTSEDLPLWAIRQVHAGKEFFRTMLFVSESTWSAMLQFYKLVLDCDPEVKREDFCLFTVATFPNFNIQLALKKLQNDTKPRVLESVKLQFRVNDLSNIVSLLPNVCRPLSDTRWETTDNDGNVVVLETQRYASQSNSSFSDRCSLSDKSSVSGRHSIREERAPVQKRRRENTVSMRIREPLRNTQENQRTTSTTQRTRSLIENDKLLQKIKLDNMTYRLNAVNSIKQKHSGIRRSQSAYRHVTQADDNRAEEEDRPTGLKSFYV